MPDKRWVCFHINSAVGYVGVSVTQELSPPSLASLINFLSVSAGSAPFSRRRELMS